eukprot:434007-Hanusia_phi.AAC.1
MHIQTSGGRCICKQTQGFTVKSCRYIMLRARNKGTGRTGVRVRGMILRIRASILFRFDRFPV